MRIRNGLEEFFCLRSNLSNDMIISAQWPGLKTILILKVQSENGCGEFHFLVRNRVRIWRTGRHTPTKNSQGYPPGTRINSRFHVNDINSFALNLALKQRLQATRKWPIESPIERFHMTSRRPYWCSKTMKRRSCWCTKTILWELNSFLTKTFSFVSINLHRCWPRE